MHVPELESRRLNPQPLPRRHWSRWGGLSTLLARRLPTATPPILVLSLPRSGSSWVGATLGGAPNAMYLREPFTQTRIRSDAAGSYPKKEWAFDCTAATLPANYWQIADDVFGALPCFDRIVVRDGAQWPLRGRARRRVVVKEVRPLANFWLVPRYRPRVVFLARHPVAVALSFQKMGWFKPSCDDDWRRNGELQARALSVLRDRLASHGDHRQITYERLCADPLREFRSLVDFAGLEWGEAIEQSIREHSLADVENEARPPYDVVRTSARMIDQWRGKLADSSVEALRAGYSTHRLPWYTTDAEWSNSPRLVSTQGLRD